MGFEPAGIDINNNDYFCRFVIAIYAGYMQIMISRLKA
jgi:hypothetical protein